MVTRSHESLANHLDRIETALEKGGNPLSGVPLVPPLTFDSHRTSTTPGGLNSEGMASVLNTGNTLSSPVSSQDRRGTPPDLIANMAPHVMEFYTPDEVAACEKVYRFCVAHRTTYSLEGALPAYLRTHIGHLLKSRGLINNPRDMWWATDDVLLPDGRQTFERAFTLLHQGNAIQQRTMGLDERIKAQLQEIPVKFNNTSMDFLLPYWKDVHRILRESFPAGPTITQVRLILQALCDLTSVETISAGIRFHYRISHGRRQPRGRLSVSY